MKKLLIIVSLLGVLFALPVVVRAEGVNVVVDGVKIEFPDAQPFIDENNRVLVPVRFVSEQLGGTVGWDAKTQTVSLTNVFETITFKIGEDKALLPNGYTPEMGTKAIIKDDRTFVPLRFAGCAMRSEVKWDATTNTASISTTAPEAFILHRVSELTYFGHEYINFPYPIVIDKAGLYQAKAQYAPQRSTIHMTVYTVNDMTLLMAKKVLRIYFPTSFETIYNEMLNILEVGGLKSKMDFDGRQVSVGKSGNGCTVFIYE